MSTRKTSAPVARRTQFDAGFAIPWEHAFNKFGFDDGAYDTTYEIAKALEHEGFEIEVSPWGLHNSVISSIIKKADGRQMIPQDNSAIELGYTDPREYLPEEIISLLDELFPY